MDLTVTGCQQALAACDTRLQFPYAPTLQLCLRSQKRNSLSKKGGTSKTRYWPQAALRKPLLQRADWLRNANFQYLNPGRA